MRLLNPMILVKIRTALFLLPLLALLTTFGAPPAPTVKSPAERSANLQLGIPSESDQMIDRSGFALGYSKSRRQALWVSYILTAEHLNAPQVRRSNKFRPDPDLKFDPVRPQQYNRTGFDRGHLAPASDMTYSRETMEQSFFMTNISPQLPACNRGIWKRIESTIRAWARQESHLYVITGPIFLDGEARFMKNTDIRIPDAFYKVALDLSPPMKMIAFIVPNRASKKPVRSFVVTVDEVEAMTGLNFFGNLDDPVEAELEKRSDITEWRIGADEAPTPPPAPAKRKKTKTRK